MRKSGFYPHLALTNILRNGQFYLPYLLTCSATVAMFYILTFLTSNDMIDTMPGAQNLQIILNLGCIVVGLFSLVIVAYSNSFIMKRRRRELGLYNILGMEKRHIARLLCCESLLLGIGCILCGLALGILLSKLILLLLLKLLHFTVKMGFSISTPGLYVTASLFLAIFLLILLRNLFQIRLSKPVELLHSNVVGEREPKTKWIIAILGVLTLGSGYTIANVVKSPLQALLLFFVAVLLVIIGTYCLFTAGSIALLKRLRANKNYYYKTNHFTAISGLLYRMKQNAVGLASICILSTMVLVTVSTTVCLYLGSDQVLNLLYPTDVIVSLDLNSKDQKLTADAAQTKVKTIVAKSGRSITTFRGYNRLEFEAQLKGSVLSSNNSNNAGDSGSSQFLSLITEATYHRITGKQVVLSKNEVLCHSRGIPLPNQFSFGNLQFTIKQRLADPPLENQAAYYASNAQYLIVADDSVLNKIYQINKSTSKDSTNIAPIRYEMDFNLDGTDSEKLACYHQLTNSKLSGTIRSHQDMASNFYMIYGGFLFLGLFLGLLFLITTIIIIYYKQISEGYEDQHRFEILQKVGMTEKEVRHSVQTQILLVFFLPLIMAGIHILAAFNMITHLLEAFNLSNIHLFALCTAGTLLSFAVIYALVYWATAKTYYKIVQARR